MFSGGVVVAVGGAVVDDLIGSGVPTEGGTSCLFRVTGAAIAGNDTIKSATTMSTKRILPPSSFFKFLTSFYHIYRQKSMFFLVDVLGTMIAVH